MKSIKKYLVTRLQRIIDSRMNDMGCRSQRGVIMSYAFELAAKSGLDGPYMEFGAYNGSSFISAWHACRNALKNPVPGQKMSMQKMFAFDSFEGLPELTDDDEYGNYKVFEKGQYAFDEKSFLSRLKDNGVDLDYISTIPGYFDKTLTDDLKKKLNLEKAMIIHIDCDLFSSAVTVLGFIEDLIQDGSILLFDDYFCYKGHPEKGVRGAFRKWLAASDYIATPYMNYSWAGMMFIMHNRKSLESPEFFDRNGGLAWP